MTRQYHAPRRERLAQATRERVTASARRLFARGGYATTMEAIADDAGVAVQTVYAIFGSKRALLLALLDTMELAAELPRLTEDLRQASAQPRRQLALLVDFSCRLFHRGADVLAILKNAAAADPDLAPIWQEGEQRRRQGEAPIVKAWAESGALKPGVTEQGAADILWAFTGPDLYRLFVQECGWPEAQFQQWLVRQLETLLFDHPGDHSA